MVNAVDGNSAFPALQAALAWNGIPSLLLERPLSHCLSGGLRRRRALATRGARILFGKRLPWVYLLFDIEGAGVEGAEAAAAGIICEPIYRNNLCQVVNTSVLSSIETTRIGY